jgi:hypothetical protein
MSRSCNTNYTEHSAFWEVAELITKYRQPQGFSVVHNTSPPVPSFSHMNLVQFISLRSILILSYALCMSSKLYFPH